MKNNNRSMPSADLIPELAYKDVPKAAEWLCQAFGFAKRLQIGSHRIQLTFGTGSMVVVEAGDDSGSLSAGHSVFRGRPGRPPLDFLPEHLRCGSGKLGRRFV